MKRFSRPAYTLLELLIASAIFAGMLLAATSAISAAVSFRDENQSSYAITNYVQSLMQQLERQTSYAINAAADPAGSSWVAFNVHNFDGYGRLTAGSSNIIYCTSPAGGLTIVADSFLPTNASQLPSACSSNSNAANYNVTLAVTPLITVGSNATTNALKIKITARGIISGGTVRNGAAALEVPYTQEATVQYGNTAIPYEQVQ